ncbi:MAG: hypothetical protein GF384_06290 [Elusimicrobia bacterium]|nr:hypothetical protein [Elusimicrobiota bacterium]
MFLTRSSRKLMQFSINVAWILRRSMGGFAAGAISWLFAFAWIRIAGKDAGSMHMFLLCITSGTFLGTVSGIIEDSGYKAFTGGILGCLGGALGAILAKGVIAMYNLEPFASTSFITAWVVMGMAIGAVSGIIEKSLKKILAGMVVGMLGGALGGFAGIELYATITSDLMGQEVTRLTLRAVEMFTGGVFGATLWLFLGIIEKFYIFRRRIELKLDKKICDSCRAENPLNHWYCVQCGAALQVAAPREKIKVTPFRAIERTINAFRFMSWLCGASGIIISVVIFVVVFFQDRFSAFLYGLSIGLLAYLLVVVFHFGSDLLSSLIKITDATAQNKQS